MSQPIRKFMTPMPHTVRVDIDADKARTMMTSYRCHHLPVLDGGRLVGVLSDKDLRTIANIKGAGETPVGDLMTDEPVVIDGETDVFQAAMLMHQKKIGSVIISANAQHPWGIFTATDALAYLSKT
jgi:acetoin utilization protein AcuB